MVARFLINQEDSLFCNPLIIKNLIEFMQVKIEKSLTHCAVGVPSFCHTIEQWLYFFLYSDLFQVVIGAVVEGGEAGRVGGIAFGDADHHALAGARQQDSVSVDLIGFSLFRADV